jgi:hypothetical protein
MMEPPKVNINLPSWVGKTYVALSFLTIPWTFFLDSALPTSHVFHHWDIAWTGLDVALICMLLITGILAKRKSLWIIVTAATTGALLIIDAWFDVVSSAGGKHFWAALIMAAVVELPLAFLSYFLTYKALKRGIPRTES